MHSRSQVSNIQTTTQRPANPVGGQVSRRSFERSQSGNRLKQHQLWSEAIQAKLNVSSPNDKYEQEADRVAATVMGMRDVPREGVSTAASPPVLQRKCTECEEEEELQRKPIPGSGPVGSDFSHPAGGQPLPASEREFFQSRFGRDFSEVRVHADAQANKAARSISALAYTMGHDVVFGEGQYQPGTERGRTLMAHELAHVVQQGAAETSSAPHTSADAALPEISRSTSTDLPSVQRLGDISQRPGGLLCDLPNSTALPDTSVLFTVAASTLSPTAIADIAAFIARWNAAGADDAVRVDGFASTDGPEPLNWTLSCDRAQAVEAELTAPSSGAPGIPAAFIEIFAHGETSEFGTALPPNRRATISADLSVPPPPVCANPGVIRELDVQPVFMRTDPTDAAPTGVTWTRRLNSANQIWGKLGVTFNDVGSVTIDTALKSTGATAAEQAAIAALRTSTGVEVFLADNDVQSGDPTGAGGAVTFGPLAALCGPGKIVMADRGSSDTLLAHELGHILGIQHPGTPPNPGDPGTIMEGSGSHSVDNSTRNTMVNAAAILCPPGIGSTCLTPDP